MTRIIFFLGFLAFIPTSISFSQQIDWLQCYGGSHTEYAFAIMNTFDAGLIFAGSTMSSDGNVSNNHGQTDCWIVKINSVGDLLWQKCFGGSSIDDPNHIEQSDDYGFIVSGHTWSNDGDVIDNNGFRDAWIIKTDSLANLEWQRCIGSVDSDLSLCTTTLNDGVFVLGYSGTFTGNHGNYDCWVAKLSTSLGIENYFDHNSLAIYPNPSSGHSITLAVRHNDRNTHLTCFNTFGWEVHQQKIHASETMIIVSTWSPGIYLAVVYEDGKPMGRAKFVVR